MSEGKGRRHWVGEIFLVDFKILIFHAGAMLVIGCRSSASRIHSQVRDTPIVPALQKGIQCFISLSTVLISIGPDSFPRRPALYAHGSVMKQARDMYLFENKPC